MSQLDPNHWWRVQLGMSDFPKSGLRSAALGTLLALGAVACGGNSDGKKTTPDTSTGSVSDGADMNPAYDPVTSEPDVSHIPTADPNDHPAAHPETAATPEQEQLPPELRPPGLDISVAEKNTRVAAYLQQAASAISGNADPTRAIDQAKAALLVDETSIEAMVLLAHANVVKGYYDLAEDVLMKAFERGGKSNKQAFFLLGLVYEKTDRLDKAPVAYRNALSLDPNYTSAIMNLGVNQLRTKRYEDAVRSFERLTRELGMNDAPVWTNLGSAYRGLSLKFAVTDVGRRNKLIGDALLAYKRAISIDKNYGHAFYNLGLLYLDADPFPISAGEMDTVTRLKTAKTYFDEYRRLSGSDLKLVDSTSAVAQKLIDKEERLRKKKADREARLRKLEEKRRKRKESQGNGADDEFSGGGFE